MTKKEPSSDLAANSLPSYLHRSIANPATRKSTECNLGLKELNSEEIPHESEEISIVSSGSTSGGQL